MDLSQKHTISLSLSRMKKVSKIFKNCFDKATEYIKVLEYIGLERQF